MTSDKELPGSPALSDELVIIIAVVASVLGCSLIVSLILGFFFMCRRKPTEKKSTQAVPMYPIVKEDDEKSDVDVFVAESLFESQSDSEDAKPKKRHSGRSERGESGSGRRERSSSRSNSKRRHR